MTDNAFDEIMDNLKHWTSEEIHSPSLLMSLDNGSFHLGYYAGMGNSDSSPIDNFSPLYRTKINQLYREGQLEVTGRAFSLYPGSGRFRKLVFTKQYPEPGS